MQQMHTNFLILFTLLMGAEACSNSPFAENGRLEIAEGYSTTRVLLPAEGSLQEEQNANDFFTSTFANAQQYARDSALLLSKGMDGDQQIGTAMFSPFPFVGLPNSDTPNAWPLRHVERFATLFRFATTDGTNGEIMTSANLVAALVSFGITDERVRTALSYWPFWQQKIWNSVAPNGEIIVATDLRIRALKDGDALVNTLQLHSDKEPHINNTSYLSAVTTFGANGTVFWSATTLVLRADLASLVRSAYKESDNEYKPNEAALIRLLGQPQQALAGQVFGFRHRNVRVRWAISGLRRCIGGLMRRIRQRCNQAGDCLSGSTSGEPTLRRVSNVTSET